MKISLIAAMDQNQLIGKDNDLPWRIPADLKFFKQQTVGKTILMGRKTCQSLPFALPKRRNLVLSRDAAFNRTGFETITSLEQAPKTEDLMVIGGATIYQLLLPMASELIITKIHASFAGDTYFPTVDWSKWQVQRLTNNPISASNPDHEFDFIFYKKL